MWGEVEDGHLWSVLRVDEVKGARGFEALVEQPGSTTI
jgi:hypothetical protein